MVTSEFLKYQAYYTKSDYIVDYMVSMLNLQPCESILEPCGGDGVFVDKIRQMGNGVSIDVLELNPLSVDLLKEKYKHCNNIFIKHTDTLLDEAVINCRKTYDKIIGNPPYGARNDKDKKNLLNILYPNLYTKESYTLFLYLCTRSLKEGGRLCFILPDTFLSLHRHESLRKFILTNAKILELSMFPSSFFPGIKFGYANLCIITLEKCSNITENLKNNIVVRSDFRDVSELVKQKGPGATTINQGEVLNNVSSAFMFKSSSLIELINSRSILKIGDIADCVTGFYSGEDKKYLHPVNHEIKNAKKYTCASPLSVRRHPLSDIEKRDGISAKDNLIPIVKGGNIEYIKPTLWFMDWSEKSVGEYRLSKKCRFQNSDYYFKEGIAIPMIRSSKMTAALMECRLFDQSIVGVFPKDIKLLKYLLAFFNTEVCTEIINAINPSTNNSANYIKKIPFIIPDDEVKQRVDNIVDEIIGSLKSGNGKIDALKAELDGIFNGIYRAETIRSKSKKKAPVRQLALPGL